MLFLFLKLEDQDKDDEGIVTSVKDRLDKLPVLGVKAEQTKEQKVEAYLKRHDSQVERRWGYVSERPDGKELHAMMEKIQTRLYGVFDIPKGKMVLIDSPQINAYVIRGKSDVYVHMGLLNALALWCERHGKKLTEDKIAMVLSHEMTHIEQGTEEKGEDEERKGGIQDIKNMEYDADKVGLIRLAQAGYNPKEGVEIMGFLKSLGEGIPIFSTHPRNFDRERELQEEVEDTDGFMPNVTKAPTPVLDEITKKITSGETLGHPGTRLYRKEGLDNLEAMMEGADNFNDALEIAELAQIHDLRMLAEHEKEKDEFKLALCKKMVLFNFYKVAAFLESSAFGSTWPQVSHVQSPHKRDAYFQKEFDYKSKFSGLTFDDSKLIENTEKNLKEAFEEFKKWMGESYQKSRKALDGEIFSVENSEERKQKIEIAEKKLNIFKAFIDNDCALVKKAYEEADLSTLELLINQTEIDHGKDKSRQSRGLPDDILDRSAAEIAEWCQTHGDIFFTSRLEARDRGDQFQDDSRGTVARESVYEKFLPAQFDEEDDLETVEGRRNHIINTLLHQAYHGIDNIQQKQLVEIEKSLTDNRTLPKIDSVSNCSVNQARVLPGFTKSLQARYAVWGLKSSGKLAEFVAKTSLELNTRGYDPAEFKALVATLEPDDLKKILGSLPGVVVDRSHSSSELFLNELGGAYTFNASASLMQITLEKNLVHFAKERLGELGETEEVLDPKSELAKIQDLLEKSTNELGSLYIPRILELVDALNPKNAEELSELVKPFLIASGGKATFLRESLFRDTVEKFRNKIPLIEILKFHEEEGKHTLWKFFKSVWDKQTEKSKLSEVQQLEFLEAFLRLLPGVIRPSDEEEADAKKIVTEYIELYAKLHPGESIKKPLALAILEGAIEYNHTHPIGPDSDLLINQQIDNGYNSLQREEILELAKLIVEKKNIKNHQPEHVAQDIAYAALAHLNNKPVPKLNNLRKELDIDPKNFFDINVPIAVNLARIQEYVYLNKNGTIVQCLKAYGLYSEYSNNTDENLRKIVETAEENPAAAWPTGAVRLFDPMWKSSKYFRPLFEGIKFSEADDYDAGAAKSFLELFKKDKARYVRNTVLYEYVKRFGYIDGQIHNDPNDEIVKIREKFGATGMTMDVENGSKPDIPLLDRAKRIIYLAPEETDFKDNVFIEIEELELKRHNLKTEGHRIVPVATMPVEVARELYDFYTLTIPHLADLDGQQLWSRRADDLYNDFLVEGGESFASELSRICTLYPTASKVRDEALLRLGDTSLVGEPIQAKEISSLMFDNQRRKPEDREKTQQKFLEYFSEIVAKLSRNEKKDFVLWAIDASGQPPLTLRAFGGHHQCSVESIPDIIFAATAEEREEFFIRMLYGENGVLDPREEKGKVIFDELLDSAFEKIFPAAEASPEERKIIKTVFVTVFNSYSSLRRCQIFISMMEALKSEKGQSTFAERLRIMMEQLGPVFIKAGQVMSEEEKADGKPLLKPDIQKEFRGLKQSVKSFHRIGAFQSLDSMGAFEEQNENRILQVGDKLGSASIKVVFRSFNAQGNKEVVKVRRPSIGKHLEEDLFVLEKVVEALRTEGVSVPPGIDKKIRTWIREEANFDLEMKNHGEVGAVLEKYNEVRDQSVLPEVKLRVPRVFRNSSEHIQEEFAEGLSLEDLMGVKRDSLDLDKLLVERFSGKTDLSEEKQYYTACLSNLDQYRALAFDSLMYQIFKGGRFHSDMHAGNIILKPDNELILIDLGSAGEIREEKGDAVREFFHGYIFSSNAMLRNFMPQGLDPDSLIKQSLKRLVSGDIESKLPEIEAIIANKSMDGKKQFIKILEIISTDEFVIDEGFEKFMKAMATGSYLKNGLDIQALQSIVRHAPVKVL